MTKTTQKPKTDERFFGTGRSLLAIAGFILSREEDSELIDKIKKALGKKTASNLPTVKMLGNVGESRFEVHKLDGDNRVLFGYFIDKDQKFGHSGLGYSDLYDYQTHIRERISDTYRKRVMDTLETVALSLGLSFKERASIDRRKGIFSPSVL